MMYIDWSDTDYVRRSFNDTFIKLREDPRFEGRLVGRVLGVERRHEGFRVSIGGSNSVLVKEDDIDFSNVRLGYTEGGRYLTRTVIRNDWRQGLRLRNVRVMDGWRAHMASEQDLSLENLQTIFKGEYKHTVDEVINEAPNLPLMFPVSRDVAVMNCSKQIKHVFHRGIFSGVFAVGEGLYLGKCRFLKERMEKLGFPTVNNLSVPLGTADGYIGSVGYRPLLDTFKELNV